MRLLVDEDLVLIVRHPGPVQRRRVLGITEIAAKHELGIVRRLAPIRDHVATSSTLKRRERDRSGRYSMSWWK